MDNSPFIVNKKMDTVAQKQTEPTGNKYIKYGITAVVIVLLLIILYFIFTKVADGESEKYVDKPVRSDTESDFDVATSIKQLENLQEKYLASLTSQRNKS